MIVYAKGGGNTNIHVIYLRAFVAQMGELWDDSPIHFGGGNGEINSLTSDVTWFSTIFIVVR